MFKENILPEEVLENEKTMDRVTSKQKQGRRLAYKKVLVFVLKPLEKKEIS